MPLSEASRLLGVSAGTLRRWSDSGRIQVFTTPGGHRRFNRPAIERMLPAGRAPRLTLVRSGMTPARLARAYRREAAAAELRFAWLATLTDEQRGWFRIHGRRMAELLLAYLEAPDEPAAEHHLDEATAEAAAYGRMGATLGLSLSQAVEGFLDFRRPFLHELAQVAHRRGADVTTTTDLLEGAERVLDRLLIGTMSAHNIRRARQARTPRPAVLPEAAVVELGADSPSVHES